MSPNRPNRPTDSQLARALRGALPAEAVPGLHARIRAEVAATPQRRAGGWSVLAVPDPRLRAVLLAAALLLALALGTLIVGSVVERTNRPDGDLLLAGPVRNGLIAVSANPLGIREVRTATSTSWPMAMIRGASSGPAVTESPRHVPSSRRTVGGWRSASRWRAAVFRPFAAIGRSTAGRSPSPA